MDEGCVGSWSSWRAPTSKHSPRAELTRATTMTTQTPTPRATQQSSPTRMGVNSRGGPREMANDSIDRFREIIRVLGVESKSFEPRLNQGREQSDLVASYRLKDSRGREALILVLNDGAVGVAPFNGVGAAFARRPAATKMVFPRGRDERRFNRDLTMAVYRVLLKCERQ